MGQNVFKNTINNVDNDHRKSSKQKTSDASPSNVHLKKSPSEGNVEKPMPIIDFSIKMVPIEELSKILQQKTASGTNNKIPTGILSDIFVRYVFYSQSAFGKLLFDYMHGNAHATTDNYLTLSAFCQQCENLLCLINDRSIVELYVKVFINSSNAIDNNQTMKAIEFRNLIETSFSIAIQFYPNDLNDCNYDMTTNRAVIESIVTGCYSQLDKNLSIDYICRWLMANCKGLILNVHNFTVHQLSVAYRLIKQDSVSQKSKTKQEASSEVVQKNRCDTDLNAKSTVPTLPLSYAWLLTSVLPSVYNDHNLSNEHAKQIVGEGTGGMSVSSSAEQRVLKTTNSITNRLISIFPTHWTQLYNSDEHGIGANRFQHHLFGYRGPTIIKINIHSKSATSNGSSSDVILCICSTHEWRETYQYQGNGDSFLIQLLPKFIILEHSAKMCYLNMAIRGYPKGLRIGIDTKAPIVAIDENFDTINYRGVSYPTGLIEIWGCGNQQVRDIQLDIKRWQLKEAERQRKVKLTAADWMEHPDRYLLELGGRTQYNTTAS